VIAYSAARRKPRSRRVSRRLRRCSPHISTLTSSNEASPRVAVELRRLFQARENSKHRRSRKNLRRLRLMSPGPRASQVVHSVRADAVDVAVAAEAAGYGSRL